MKHISKLFLFVSFVLILTTSIVSAQSAGGKGIIRVTGGAVIAVTPDVAYITLGVETRDQSAETASQRNSELMTNVIKVLKEYGLTDQELTTSGYSIYSYQEADPSSNPARYQTVYYVRNQVNIKTKHLEDIGTIIDLAIKAGANQVQGISFDVENKAELQLVALKNATEQARRKAEAIAAAAGVEIQGIADITEQSDTYAPYTDTVLFKNALAESVRTPINPGDVQVKSSVVVEFTF